MDRDSKFFKKSQNWADVVFNIENCENLTIHKEKRKFLWKNLKWLGGFAEIFNLDKGQIWIFKNFNLEKKTSYCLGP